MGTNSSPISSTIAPKTQDNKENNVILIETLAPAEGFKDEEQIEPEEDMVGSNAVVFRPLFAYRRTQQRRNRIYAPRSYYPSYYYPYSYYY